jgi:hypothetical protein
MSQLGDPGSSSWSISPASTIALYLAHRVGTREQQLLVRRALVAEPGAALARPS